MRSGKRRVPKGRRPEHSSGTTVPGPPFPASEAHHATIDDRTVS